MFSEMKEIGVSKIPLTDRFILVNDVLNDVIYEMERVGTKESLLIAVAMRMSPACRDLFLCKLYGNTQSLLY